MNDFPAAPLGRIMQRSLVVGIAVGLLSAWGAYTNWTRFLQAYVVAYFYWLNISLGCFALLMLQHMIKGKWGYVIRRSLEAGASTLPLMVLFFIPLVAGHARLYPAVPPTGFKAAYLNLPFFLGRAVFYFAIWVLFAWFLTKWSDDQDRTGDPVFQARLTRLSGPGIVLFGLTITFAAVDWAMSLEAGFFSTIYGMIFIVAAALVAMSFVVVITMLLARYKPLSEVATPERFHNYGNLLLVFVMLWAYLSFAQFLIIWAGNLQDEIPWYVTRAFGTWGVIALFLVLFHFAIPFILLLNRPVTKSSRALAGVAIALFIMGWVDLYWIIQPSFFPHGPQVNWVDFAAPVGVGGLWMAMFCRRLKSRPLLPLHDPRFEGVLQDD
jgi:hypothetical protein